MKAPLLTVAIVLLAPLVSAQPQDVEWPQHGGADNIRYSPLDQINRANVDRSCRSRGPTTRATHFKGSEMQSHPVVVDGVALRDDADAEGRGDRRGDRARAVEVRSVRRHRSPRTRFRHRGVTVHEDRVFVTYRNFLWAIDRRDRPADRGVRDRRPRSICAKVSAGRSSALTVSASTPGAIFEDLLILGSSVPETLPGTPGHIRAFDVDDRQAALDLPHDSAARRVRLRHVAERRVQLSGGANAWAGVTVDPTNAMVFAATGSASFDFYGVNRHGDNLFANCVLALDARTGKRVWHFQAIKHDLWDWDFPAAPSLVTVTRDGRPVEAVAQITKNGYVFVLDRATGTPLFPIE